MSLCACACACACRELTLTLYYIVRLVSKRGIICRKECECEVLGIETGVPIILSPIVFDICFYYSLNKIPSFFSIVLALNNIIVDFLFLTYNIAQYMYVLNTTLSRVPIILDLSVYKDGY